MVISYFVLKNELGLVGYQAHKRAAFDAIKLLEEKVNKIVEYRLKKGKSTEPPTKLSKTGKRITLNASTEEEVIVKFKLNIIEPVLSVLFKSSTVLSVLYLFFVTYFSVIYKLKC